MEDNKQIIGKFTNTSIWDFSRALEVILSEVGIQGSIAGVYDLYSAFLIAIKQEQEKPISI